LKTPLSVRYVAACEWCLAGVSGFLGLMYLVYGFYGILRSDLIRVLISTAWAIAFTAVGAGCFYTASALWQGRRWAWRVSWLIGLIAAAPGGFFIWVTHRPWPGYRGEEGWGSWIGVALVLPAVLGFISLVLPRTRGFFAGHDA
jgi:hypothetical protein